MSMNHLPLPDPNQDPAVQKPQVDPGGHQVSALDSGEEVFQYQNITATGPDQGEPNAPLGAVHNLACYVLNTPLKQPPEGLNSAFVYVVLVAMDDRTQSAICTFVHYRLWTPAELQKKVKLAVETVVKTRMAPRRKTLKIKPDHDIKQANDQFFRGDVKFFEATMCDRFDFRVIMPINTDTQLPRTIRA